MFRVVLTHYNEKLLMTLFEDEHPVEISLFHDNPYPVGAIFNGRVQKIQDNISASFLDLAPHLTGFLPKTCYKCGDLVPVQIVREGTKTKDPELTDSLSISGRYSVVYAKEGELHVSSKLGREEKKKLIAQIKPLLKDNKHAIVLRTNAAHVDPDVVMEEIVWHFEQLAWIQRFAPSRPMGMLYSPQKEWVRALMGLYTKRLDEIVTDDPTIYSMLEDMFDQNSDSVHLRFYEDADFSLLKLYSLEKHLKEALQKRVWLKCGGFLVIEQTEALVSIDVNSGKIKGTLNKEETVFQVNLEAAEEIARQVRLRNLSGIIMIDFINMQEPQHKKQLLDALEERLRSDPVKTQVHGMTTLGLVEMTRMKGRKTLYEQARTVSDDETVSGDKGRI
ncbi:MAG: ribonuclease E/G [Lachnospiraceae bacterium]|nr:ribonuclease E/G [Lachnospiraceae bacterium]